MNSAVFQGKEQALGINQLIKTSFLPWCEGCCLCKPLTPCVPTISFPCHVPDRLLCLVTKTCVSGQWRAVITHPFCNVCAHRITIHTDCSGLPSRSVLATPHFLAKASPSSVLCEVLLHLEPVYIHHLLCASKPVVLYVTQYVSSLFYFVRVNFLCF